MSMTYILYLSVMCVTEQTMCCNVWIEEWENTLILFDCCMISDTVLLSGSFREECVCVFRVSGRRASLFYISIWGFRVTGCLPIRISTGKRNSTRTSCFCSGAVFHFDKRTCVGLTAWILIRVIFHSCWLSLMLMKDLVAFPPLVSSKCPEFVVLGDSIILTAGSFVSRRFVLTR